MAIRFSVEMKIESKNYGSMKIAPQKIATYENCPLWK